MKIVSPATPSLHDKRHAR